LRSPALALLVQLSTACSHGSAPGDAWSPADAAAEADAAVSPVTVTDLPTADPGDEGLSLQPLIDMTSWVIQTPNVAIFSLLLSRHGSLVYELYTPGIERNEAHFQMSTSKSVTSAIVGAALDRGLLPSTDASVADLLPARLFAGSSDIARFKAVTLKDVMGMSALDANEPPHDTSDAGVAIGRAFSSAPNRVVFALTQALLPTPGTSYQYNDVTPMLAGGAVQYATGKRLFDFGTEVLFAPMGFGNAEWVGEDPTGIDLASYGLRLRPIDMQKFGILFLNHGRWGTQQLLSTTWVDTSWTAYMNTGPDVTPGYKNYGWYWWHRSDWGTEVHWTVGWRGQFIVDMPAYDAVFTMTADIETGDEDAVLASLMTHYVVPALTQAVPATPMLKSTLVAQIAAAHEGASRVNLTGDPRMIPSVAAQGTSIPFNPNAM
jgi:CubicO group peptidase (beta-lactamase class C family)